MALIVAGRAQDPEAKIILGGMFGTPPDAGESAENAWQYLRALY